MKKHLFVWTVGAFALFFVPAAAQAAVAHGPFSFSQDRFDFTYVIGGGLPTLQNGTMTNTTDGAVTFVQSVPNQPPWFTTSFNTDPLTLAPGTPAGIGVSVSPAGLSAGTYTAKLIFSGSFSGSPVALPITLTVLPAGSAVPDSQIHPEGTNILGPDGTIYRIMNGARYPYTSSGAFLSYSFNKWSDVQRANIKDMALPVPQRSDGPGAAYITPRDGSLINDHGTVYIVYDHYRQGFASADVFAGFGYSYKNVLSGDTSFLTTLSPANSSQDAHLPGTVFKDGKKYCFIPSPFEHPEGGKYCFESLAAMKSWGYSTGDVVPENSHDRQLPVTAAIAVKQPYNLMNP